MRMVEPHMREKDIDHWYVFTVFQIDILMSVLCGIKWYLCKYLMGFHGFMGSIDGWDCPFSTPPFISEVPTHLPIILEKKPSTCGYATPNNSSSLAIVSTETVWKKTDVCVPNSEKYRTVWFMITLVGLYFSIFLVVACGCHNVWNFSEHPGDSTSAAFQQHHSP